MKEKMSIRIVISDTSLIGHPENVRAGILAEYDGITEDEIIIRNGGFAADISYASSVGAIAVVRSINDLNSWITAALQYYPTIQAFFAFISNVHTSQPLPSAIPNIITAGAGTLANQTAYGPGLEFWDEDLDTADPALASYANGRVAGKILKIKDTLGCSWWEARYRARMTASEGGVRDAENGYGKINVTAAIAYSGTILYDPYQGEIPDPGEGSGEVVVPYVGYCTQTVNVDGDIAPSRISHERLLQLASEGTVGESISSIQGVINGAIEDADSTIDGYCSKVLAVPISPVPKKIKSLSQDIAVYNLFSKRIEISGGDVMEGIKKRYDDAILFLKDVAKGIARIDGVITPTPNTKTTGGSFHANDRVFSKENLDRL